MEEIDKKQASDIWWEVFGYVKEYSERHNGNMDDIPLYFVLLRKDGQTVNIRDWVLEQQEKFKGRTESKRRKALEEIGVKFSKKVSQWDAIYPLAQQFYQKNGHLCIPTGFITTDDYTEKGIRLYDRLHDMKNKVSPESEKHHLLDCIGMIWDKTNKYKILELFHDLGIDGNKNTYIVLNKAIAEVKVKIAYIINDLYSLKPDNDIVDEAGLLHEIFYMRDSEIKSCYGVTLAKLIEKYNDITLEDLVQLYNCFQCDKRVLSCRGSK